jgi:hypothetical protein
MDSTMTPSKSRMRVVRGVLSIASSVFIMSNAYSALLDISFDNVQVDMHRDDRQNL